MGGVGHCQPYLVFVLWGRGNDCKILNDFLCVFSFTSTRLTTEGGRGGEGGREEGWERGREEGGRTVIHIQHVHVIEIKSSEQNKYNNNVKLT